MSAPDASTTSTPHEAPDEASDAPTTFEEFWPYYVSQHLNETNRQLHFVGTSLALGCVAVSPVFPPALLAAPVAGYGFAWVGHFVFEKNKPATFGNPLWSLRGDFRMYGKMLRGKMREEIERLQPHAAEGDNVVPLHKSPSAA